MVPPAQLVLRHPVATVVVAAGTFSLLTLSLYSRLRKRPSREELELARRTHLAATGRIIDGSLLDANPTFTQPTVIIYQYRIAGVVYECSQDISLFTPQIHDLDIDLPIQVRYDPANPGDSIVIAESWSGLWSMNPIKPVMKQ